jgi:hypothetical protein
MSDRQLISQSQLEPLLEIDKRPYVTPLNNATITSQQDFLCGEHIAHQFDVMAVAY